MDFKETEVLEDSLSIIVSKLDRIQFPVWINADIVRGPSRSRNDNDLDVKLVNPDIFLSLTNQYLPEATVSPGEFKQSSTTFRNETAIRISLLLGYTADESADPPEYTMEQADAMVKVLNDNGYLNNGKEITYPIRARYAGNTPKVLECLAALKVKFRLTSTVHVVFFQLHRLTP